MHAGRPWAVGGAGCKERALQCAREVREFDPCERRAPPRPLAAHTQESTTTRSDGGFWAVFCMQAGPGQWVARAAKRGLFSARERRAGSILASTLHVGARSRHDLLLAVFSACSFVFFELFIDLCHQPAHMRPIARTGVLGPSECRHSWHRRQHSFERRQVNSAYDLQPLESRAFHCEEVPLVAALKAFFDEFHIVGLVVERERGVVARLHRVRSDGCFGTGSRSKEMSQRRISLRLDPSLSAMVAHSAAFGAGCRAPVQARGPCAFIAFVVGAYGT